MTSLAIIVLLGYLIGSVPTGLLVGRFLDATDVRRAGSGSSGATNVLRVLGWKPALAVLIVDVAKGWVAAAWVPPLVGVPPEWTPGVATLVAGAAAVVGHVWPLTTGFGGGKGVATTAGATLAVSPGAAGVCLGLFVVVLAVSRRASIASIVAAACLAPALAAFEVAAGRPVATELMAYGILLGLFLVFTHRSNVRRLLRGEESPLV